jgi:hypothetical protein
LANGKQRFVAAAFIDGLTPDVQKMAGLLGRKHAPGTLHWPIAMLNLASEINCLRIELRHRRPDGADIREDPR